MDGNNTENVDDFLDQADKTDNLQFVVFNIEREIRHRDLKNP